MGDYVSDGEKFSCPFCTGNIKLSVSSCSMKGDGKNVANTDNYSLSAPGAQCTIIPGAPPPPCTPSGKPAINGQSPANVDGAPALGASCMIMCAKGGPMTVSSPAQSSAHHDGAAGAASIAASAVAAAPEKKSKKSKDPDDKAVEEYFVYQYESSTGVEYVGITNNPERRGEEHQGSGKPGSMKRLNTPPGMTKEEARCVEQALIEKYGRIKDRWGNPLGGKLQNKINSISPKKKNYAERVQKGVELLKKMKYSGF